MADWSKIFSGQYATEQDSLKEVEQVKKRSRLLRLADPKSLNEVENRKSMKLLKKFNTSPDSLSADDKIFLYSKSPRLFPQFAPEPPPKPPVDPTKGMTELEKSEYNIGMQDQNWANTIGAVADSQRVFKATGLAQFMPSEQKQSKINLIKSKIRALEGEIASTSINPKTGKPYKGKGKAYEKALADLEFQKSELLRFQGLRSSDPFGLY